MKTLVAALVIGISLTTGCWGAEDTQSAQGALASESKHAAATAQPTQRNLHLPLDHGPRAEVTPWVNQQRRLRAQRDEHTRPAQNEGK